MARETPNPLIAGAAVIEDYYTRTPDVASHVFSPAIIRLALSLAVNDYTRSQAPRVVQIAACMYRSLTEEQRLHLGDLNLPAEVMSALEGAPPEWPEPLPPEDYSAPGADVLDFYRGRMAVALRVAIDREAGKVIVGGDRMVMTQLSQVMEARAVLFEQFTEEGPTAEEFPHLAAYAQIKGLPTITAAASSVLELANAWGRANAGLELIRARATMDIRAAQSAYDVRAAYDLGLAQATAVVAQVLDAMA